MNIPYRTRRVLNRIGVVLVALLLVGIVAWLCWVIWLERYIVYTDDGASLDFSLSSQELSGEVAVPPVAAENISIYYNEGADALDTTNALTQLEGYYIDISMLQNNIGDVWENIEILPAGTPVLIDLKGGYGSFYYSSKLGDAIHSQAVSVAAVDELIKELQKRGFYTIARISAFRDYNFGLNHVSSGLMHVNRLGLWPDEGNCYWLDPSNATTVSWVTSIILELKELGFHEVVLTDFRFPDSEQYIFNADKDETLVAVMNTLLTSCSADDFVLSFSVDRADFPLPEGRCRMYLEGIEPQNVAATAAQVIIVEPEVRLVFVAQTNDTRFNEYSVLRSLDAAESLEAQKADEAENNN